jgi:hypothetical protein
MEYYPIYDLCARLLYRKKAVAAMGKAIEIYRCFYFLIAF